MLLFICTHSKRTGRLLLCHKNRIRRLSLKVEYVLTPRGAKTLETQAILQHVGIDYMLEAGQEDFLREHGII